MKRFILGLLLSFGTVSLALQFKDFQSAIDGNMSNAELLELLNLNEDFRNLVIVEYLLNSRFQLPMVNLIAMGTDKFELLLDQLKFFGTSTSPINILNSLLGDADRALIDQVADIQQKILSQNLLMILNNKLARVTDRPGSVSPIAVIPGPLPANGQRQNLLAGIQGFNRGDLKKPAPNQVPASVVVPASSSAVASSSPVPMQPSALAGLLAQIRGQGITLKPAADRVLPNKPTPPATTAAPAPIVNDMADRLRLARLAQYGSDDESGNDSDEGEDGRPLASALTVSAPAPVSAAAPAPVPAPTAPAPAVYNNSLEARAARRAAKAATGSVPVLNPTITSGGRVPGPSQLPTVNLTQVERPEWAQNLDIAIDDSLITEVDGYMAPVINKLLAAELGDQIEDATLAKYYLLFKRLDKNPAIGIKDGNKVVIQDKVNAWVARQAAAQKAG